MKTLEHNAQQVLTPKQTKTTLLYQYGTAVLLYPILTASVFWSGISRVFNVKSSPGVKTLLQPFLPGTFPLLLLKPQQLEPFFFLFLKTVTQNLLNIARDETATRAALSVTPSTVPSRCMRFLPFHQGKEVRFREVQA